MAEQQQHKPGGHYSGANPVPTISKFLESLDKDKKARDAEIDQRKAHPQDNSTSDATPHKTTPRPKDDSQQVVRDPVTGKDVVIENSTKEMMDNVENPQVCTLGQNVVLDKADIKSFPYQMPI